MTLIVGYASEEIGFLVGETLLTPLLEVKGNPVGPVNGEFHGLKIQIIDDNTAIAFASPNRLTQVSRSASAGARRLSICKEFMAGFHLWRARNLAPHYGYAGCWQFGGSS